MSEDEAFARLLQAQFDEELANNLGSVTPKSDRKRTNHGKDGESSREVWTHSSPVSIIDRKWELLDPTPDIRALFLLYNDQFFWGKLAGVEVKWSPRMTVCAGLCCYEGYGGLCSIRLSTPLLKLRPRKDLVETLLHEMIHAYLFVTQNNKDHDGHGPEFCKHMNRLNTETGTNISIYHNFHDEVNLYKVHWWKCDGPCQKRPPYFGVVKRSMNRAPGPSDFWYKQHKATCGGTFSKIKEPEGFGTKKRKKDEEPDPEQSSGKKPKIEGQDIRNFIPFSGKGIKLSGTARTDSTKGRDLFKTNDNSIRLKGVQSSKDEKDFRGNKTGNSTMTGSTSRIGGGGNSSSGKVVNGAKNNIPRTGGIWGGLHDREGSSTKNNRSSSSLVTNGTMGNGLMDNRKGVNRQGDDGIQQSMNNSNMKGGIWGTLSNLRIGEQKDKQVQQGSRIGVKETGGSDKENDFSTVARTTSNTDGIDRPKNTSRLKTDLTGIVTKVKTPSKEKTLDWVSKPSETLKERQKRVERKKAKIERLKGIFSSSSEVDDEEEEDKHSSGRNAQNEMKKLKGKQEGRDAPSRSGVKQASSSNVDFIELSGSSDDEAGSSSHATFLEISKKKKINKTKTKTSDKGDIMNRSLEEVFESMRRRSDGHSRSDDSDRGSVSGCNDVSATISKVVLVDCPACIRKIPESEINQHLDQCLS